MERHCAIGEFVNDPCGITEPSADLYTPDEKEQQLIHFRIQLCEAKDVCKKHKNSFLLNMPITKGLVAILSQSIRKRKLVKFARNNNLKCKRIQRAESCSWKEMVSNVSETCQLHRGDSKRTRTITRNAINAFRRVD